MNQLRAYSIVTGAYWSFMLTDGALRMLVLLYFHELGYAPITLAFLFVLYEVFGVVTNLFGGWLAQQYGLKSTLLWGLMIQPVALVGLTFLDKNWPSFWAVAFVMMVQAISGISKDLTKMSAKTSLKFLIPRDQGSKLFKWVSVLTGSKNAIKGFGFFVGGFLLSQIGFVYALWVLSAVIVVAFVFASIFLPSEIGRPKSKSKLSGIFEQNKNIKVLSLARVFLFGSRDIWFVVAVPVFLSSTFGWSFTQVGGFMAVWVIAYGFVQSFSPWLLKRFIGGAHPSGRSAVFLAAVLTFVMAGISVLFLNGVMIHETIVVGLFVFGIAFAMNSSVHSFLVLDYANGDKAAVNVGFYYMANAVGRLVGTLLSGLLFQYGGVAWALLGSTVFLGIVSLVSMKLPREIEMNTQSVV